ncbi:transposase [Actinomadura luteofluorescens]|uniref:transposase n=1 Tax=Actinomadura luteofluorescens TaxID=46163 RepID=UPI0036408C85
MSRRPRGHPSGDEAVRPDRRAVGGAGAVAAAPRPTGRPPKWSRRQLIDGIRWRVRVGSPWRDVPVQYGP